jgi:hypothetical protein
MCIGIIDGLKYAASGVCAPPDATLKQAVSIVVDYIDSRPERMHEYFNALALEALRAAWPCKN